MHLQTQNLGATLCFNQATYRPESAVALAQLAVLTDVVGIGKMGCLGPKVESLVGDEPFAKSTTFALRSVYICESVACCTLAI